MSQVLTDQSFSKEINYVIQILQKEVLAAMLSNLCLKKYVLIYNLTSKLPVQHWTNSTYLWISRWNCCLALSNPKIWHGKFENISLNFGSPFWFFPKNRKWISTPLFFNLTTIQAEHVPLKFRKCLNYISSNKRKTSFRWPF